MRRNTHTTPRTRIIIALFLFMSMALTSRAQIFLSDDEESSRSPEATTTFIDMPNAFGMGTDYYIPTGSGVVLLAAMGGAYLLKKREKE